MFIILHLLCLTTGNVCQYTSSNKDFKWIKLPKISGQLKCCWSKTWSKQSIKPISKWFRLRQRVGLQGDFINILLLFPLKFEKKMCLKFILSNFFGYGPSNYRLMKFTVFTSRCKYSGYNFILQDTFNHLCRNKTPWPRLPNFPKAMAIRVRALENKSPMVYWLLEGKIFDFWRSRSLENAFLSV